MQLILHLYGMKIPAQGEVRLRDDGHGMDITFTTLGKESELRVKKAVQRWVQALSRRLLKAETGKLRPAMRKFSRKYAPGSIAI